MKKHKIIAKKRKRIITKVRSKIKGTSIKPRICVFRSNKHIFVQAIDDIKSHSISSINDYSLIKKSKITKTNSAIETGKLFAEKLKSNKITSAVFDRRYYKYTGRIKAFVESLKESGISI